MYLITKVSGLWREGEEKKQYHVRGRRYLYISLQQEGACRRAKLGNGKGPCQMVRRSFRCCASRGTPTRAPLVHKNHKKIFDGGRVFVGWVRPLVRFEPILFRFRSIEPGAPLRLSSLAYPLGAERSSTYFGQRVAGSDSLCERSGREK